MTDRLIERQLISQVSKMSAALFLLLIISVVLVDCRTTPTHVGSENKTYNQDHEGLQPRGDQLDERGKRHALFEGGKPGSEHDIQISIFDLKFQELSVQDVVSVLLHYFLCFISH